MSRDISVLSIRELFFFLHLFRSTLNCRSRIAVHPKGLSYASGGEDGFVRVHHFDDSYFKTQPYGDLQIED